MEVKEEMFVFVIASGFVGLHVAIDRERQKHCIRHAKTS